MNDSVE